MHSHFGISPDDYRWASIESKNQDLALVQKVLEDKMYLRALRDNPELFKDWIDSNPDLFNKSDVEKRAAILYSEFLLLPFVLKNRSVYSLDLSKSCDPNYKLRFSHLLSKQNQYR